MPANGQPDLRMGFEAFAKDAYLDVLVPQENDFDATALLKDALPESLPRASMRRHLLYGTSSNLYQSSCLLLMLRQVDETISIQLVLRTSSGKEAVGELLPHLDVAISAHATNAVPEGSGNAATASGKYDLTSHALPSEPVPEIVIVGDLTYAVWKAKVHLPRPRVRLQRPAVYFTATVSLSQTAIAASRSAARDEYLPSCAPLSANLLEPLRFDPSLSSANLYLPASRITKIAPGSALTADTTKPIRGASKRAFPAIPALMLRVRYTPLPDCIVASVHLEISQLIATGLTIHQFEMDTTDARVEQVNKLDWPKQAYAGDEIVLCYKLRQTYESRAIQGASPPASLRIKALATAILEGNSTTELDVRWQGQVELADPSPKPPLKWSRPLSASIRNSIPPAPRPLSTEFIPKNTESDASVNFTFTGPLTTRKGDDFNLDVFVINKTSRARRMALVVVQPKQSRPLSTEQRPSIEVSAQSFARPKPPDVLDLNADVRIGPLPPGACYSTKMRFRAMITGVLDLGVIGVVDLETRQTVDVRELPDVVALEADISDVPASTQEQ